MKSLNIRKKLVTLAVASAVSGGAMMAMTAPAHAMNVSQNNVGQVLLFPYYTVKNGFDTVFTVTNTTNKTAIFKIRFREALNSREVLDFNVIMSPFDHWSGAVTENASGTGAVVRTFDKTCTSPDKPKWTAVGTGYEAAMFTDLFSNQYADGVSTADNVGRVKEGYFEVILMGVSNLDGTDPANEDTVEWGAKHVAGVPNDCALVDSALATDLTITAEFGDWTAPENILKGHVIYIDTDTGKAIDAEPTAIEDWRLGGHIIRPANDATPSLANGEPGAEIYQLVDGWNITTTLSGGTNSADAISMLLMANAVVNEYSSGSGASTSWVLTFPTKHFYTDFYNLNGTVENLPANNQPFSYAFKGDNDLGGLSCDTVTISYVNREEGPDEQESGTGFSGQGGTISQPKKLCYEVNVLDFNSTSVFGAGVNRLPVDTSAAGTAGWAAVNLNVTTDGGTGLNNFTGLPVIGFTAIMRDTLEGPTLNYGSSIAHTIESGAANPGRNQNQNGQ